MASEIPLDTAAAPGGVPDGATATPGWVPDGATAAPGGVPDGATAVPGGVPAGVPGGAPDEAAAIAATPAAMAISARNLVKAFKKVSVLKGISFDVPAGCIFALLGANGAGKTTIIKILVTLLKPGDGEATVNGFDVLRMPGEVRQSISLTGQFTAIDEILTGRENLVMIARLRHLQKPGQIADQMLKRFGLTEAGKRRAATYSGGMKRRLDLAMSLIGQPAVIFLDEPTTGLDPEGRLDVWATIKELAGSGTTVFLTTQYLDEAEQLADRIAILHEGQIIANNTLKELKALFPPAKVEYVEKQPTLEEIFLSITAKKEANE